MVKYTIKNEIGLHARPAAAFCAEAKKFDSEIEVRVLNEVYNAKSLIGIMGAGIEQNEEITIIAKGHDGLEAEKSLVNVLNEHINL